MIQRLIGLAKFLVIAGAMLVAILFAPPLPEDEPEGDH